MMFIIFLLLRPHRVSLYSWPDLLLVVCCPLLAGWTRRLRQFMCTELRFGSDELIRK